jgi:hypothetical protein
MRFPRAIRLDQSDLNVYDVAALPGEWALPGAFCFAETAPEELVGKTRQAFVHGFLGITSFGWSTLVEVAEIEDDDYQAVIERLASRFVTHFGAPDLEAARPVARDEAEFAAGLCEHKVHTLLSVERTHGDEGIVERFKVIEPPRGVQHARIWELQPDDGDELA